MSGREEILSTLKENNPFIAVSAGNPREDRFPDVVELGYKTFAGLLAIIAQMAKKRGLPIAAAVLGEAGAGKTHLIGRLIDTAESGRQKFSFSYIYPFTDPNQAFRYLLKEVIIDLTNTSSRGRQFSQLDSLARTVFIVVMEHVAESKGDKKIGELAAKYKQNPSLLAGIYKINPKARKVWHHLAYKYLRERYPEGDPEFFNVFLKFFFYLKARAAAIQWLSGRIISEDDQMILEVTDRAAKSSEALEEEAREIIKCLDLLLKDFGQPLVIFFDQLENISDPESIKAFQSLCGFLCDVTKSMLPVAFFRGQDWDYRFSKELNDSTVGRFKGNLFNLSGCDREISAKLIASRLDWALGERVRPNELFPFIPGYETELENTIFRYKEIHPRQVIYHANDLLNKILDQKPTVKSVTEVLQEAFEALYQEVLSNLDQFTPDEGRLTLALELYLTQRSGDSGYKVESLRRSPEKVKYIDLQGKIGVGGQGLEPLAIMIDVELHHGAVAAGLRRGIKFLEKNPDGRALFVRDNRCLFPRPPKWQATNKLLDRFHDLGGASLILDEKLAARWYALALLKFEVTAGDILLDNGATVTLDQLNAFISDRINGEQEEAFKRLDEYLAHPKAEVEPAPKKPVFRKKELPDLAVDILKSAPTRMLRAEILASRLSEELKKELTVEQLLPVLGPHQDRFFFFKAKNGLIVQLKMEWLHAQG